MRAPGLSLKRSLLLSTLFSLTLLSSGVLAQDDTTAVTTSDSPDTTTTVTSADPTTTEKTTSEKTTSAEETTSAQETTSAAATTTTSTSDGTTTSDSNMPTLSGASSNSDMPTLSSTTAANTATPTYPAATVPPTANAPYMQTSNMPDGTVFIVVGAILGAFGLAILLWRAIIACLLHRSVEKAAMAQHRANDKAPFPAPPAPFYNYTDHDSAQNVTPGRGVRRSNRGPIPSATPSQTNLFFSPTAATSPANPRDSTYRDAPNRDSSYRDSRFLPAGFYAAGNSSPHNADANESSISLNNLRPDRHARAMSGRTPPESPGFGPQRSPLPQDMSSSSVNLNPAPTGRAPSAYLDDLLGDRPEAFPPSGSPSMPPNSNHPYRQSGRF